MFKNILVLWQKKKKKYFSFSMVGVGSPLSLKIFLFYSHQRRRRRRRKHFHLLFWRRRGSARNKKIFLYDHQRRWKWTFYFLSRDGRGKFCKVAKNIFFYSHHIRRRIENIFFFSSEGWGVSLNFQKYSFILTKKGEGA